VGEGPARSPLGSCLAQEPNVALPFAGPAVWRGGTRNAGRLRLLLHPSRLGKAPVMAQLICNYYKCDVIREGSLIFATSL